MKVFISADMEGSAGITCWPETERDKPDYPEFQELMTAEVVAACEGALQAGATEIVIKDAHHTGRNLLVDRLPPQVRIIRDWAGHPHSMMFGIDGDCAAAIYTGYHDAAGTEGEWALSIDSTIVRAHQDAAGARQAPPRDVDPEQLPSSVPPGPPRRGLAGGRGQHRRS